MGETGIDVHVLVLVSAWVGHDDSNIVAVRVGFVLLLLLMINCLLVFWLRTVPPEWVALLGKECLVV